MLGDESGGPRHGVDVRIFGNADALKAFIIVNGELFRALDGRAGEHGGDLGPDCVGVLIRINPSAMKIAIVIGGEARDINAGAGSACSVGHVRYPLGFRAPERRAETLPRGEQRGSEGKKIVRHRGINGGGPLAGRKPFMPRKAEESSCPARGRSH